MTKRNKIKIIQLISDLEQVIRYAMHGLLSKREYQIKREEIVNKLTTFVRADERKYISTLLRDSEKRLLNEYQHFYA